MADEGSEYEVSSTYVSGLMRAMRSTGLLTEAVLARMAPEQRGMSSITSRVEGNAVVLDCQWLAK